MKNGNALRPQKRFPVPVRHLRLSRRKLPDHVFGERRRRENPANGSAPGGEQPQIRLGIKKPAENPWRVTEIAALQGDMTAALWTTDIRYRRHHRVLKDDQFLRCQ